MVFPSFAPDWLVVPATQQGRFRKISACLHFLLGDPRTQSNKSTPNTMVVGVGEMKGDEGTFVKLRLVK